MKVLVTPSQNPIKHANKKKNIHSLTMLYGLFATQQTKMLSWFSCINFFAKLLLVMKILLETNIKNNE